MPAPILPDGLLGASDLMLFLAQVDDRLSALESPGSPALAFVIASANLTVASAALFPNCWVIVSDLKTMAYSTGSHWIRTDTGANIV